jgi:hypothetical protein
LLSNAAGLFDIAALRQEVQPAIRMALATHNTMINVPKSTKRLALSIIVGCPSPSVAARRALFSFAEFLDLC